MPYLGNDLITADRTAEIDTKILTSVSTAVSDLVDAAPASLNTLNEIAASLGDDANFAATVTSALALKADQTSITAINNTLSTKADKSNVLALNNTTAYSPSASYHPATKGYVDAMASSGGGNVSITKGYAFTANGIQTTFDCGAASSYILGAIDIYYNGIQLDSTDFTAADGRNFTLAFTPESGALIKLVAYGGADVYTKTQTNTLLDAKANSGDVATSLALKANLSGATFTGNVSIGATATSTSALEVHRQILIKGNGSDGVEYQDWPHPSLSIRRSDNYNINGVTMMTFGYKDDPLYITENNVANIRIYDSTQAASASTSASTTRLQITSPGPMYLGAGGTAGQVILTNEGYLKKPNTPAFSTNGTSGSWSVTTTAQTVPYDKATPDINISNSYSASTSIFTAPVSGLYYVSFSALIYPSSIPTGNFITMWVSKNNNSYIDSTPMARFSYQEAQTTMAADGIVYLNQNENIRVKADCGSSTLTLYLANGHAHFSAVFLG